MIENEIIDLHMAAAHFPIALLMSNVFFDILGSILKKNDLRITSYWIHLLGLLGGLVTVLFGLIGNPFRDEMGLFPSPLSIYETPMAQNVLRHAWAGLISLFVFSILAFWRMKRGQQFGRGEQALYWTISISAVIGIGLTGYLGSEVMK